MSSHRACFAASLTLALLAPALALADRAPNPEAIKQDPPIPPPTPASDPAPAAPAVEAKVETRASDAKVEAKVETRASDAKPAQSGGMCQVGSPAGGWGLLALLGLGLGRRRRMA
jgi:MYXO-CTERM domain-containing protein